MKEEILILAPFGRDAELSAELLKREGFHPVILKSIHEISADRVHTAGAILLTEEALTADEYMQFEKTLASQETWSDLPILLLINNKDRVIKTQHILDKFSERGNVLLLERPFRLITLVATIKVALRSRRRQYEVKELLRQQAIALRARDEFLSVASHELKTPITTLKLQVQMRKRLLKRNDDSVYRPDKVNALLDITAHQIDRLGRLVDDMLDISRIESGKLSLNFEKMDLGDLVEKTYQSLAEEFSNSGCEVELEIKKGISGKWDQHRIEQAIINLFTNAIKYGAHKKVTVKVEAEEKDAVLIVKDEGFGIADKDQERIFKRFERAVTGENISGLGLGLYITKEILEMQGGSISVTSVLGKGSSFKITLPLQSEFAV